MQMQMIERNFSSKELMVESLLSVNSSIWIDGF